MTLSDQWNIKHIRLHMIIAEIRPQLLKRKTVSAVLKKQI